MYLKYILLRLLQMPFSFHTINFLFYQCCLVNLKNIVIPERFCRESSDFTAFKVARSPTQAFGDDDFAVLNFHVSSELLLNFNTS